MSVHRHRIQAAPPPPPSMVHSRPNFVSNRKFFPHIDVPYQYSHPKVINRHTSSFIPFIETSYYGPPAAYGFSGELGFEYIKSVGKQSFPYVPPEYCPLQRSWHDLDTHKTDDNVSTDFFQNQTKPDSDRFYRHTLPTDETFLSPHESEDDSDSSSDEKDKRQGRSNSNWRNPQYDSDATSSDEYSDESSEYYESDSEDEWSFPRRFENNTVPSSLTLKEAVISYEQRWNAMLTQRGGNQLTFETVPWPQYPPPRSPAEFNHRSIREFLRAAGGPSSFMLKTIFRQTMLRFHPDKSAILLAHVDERQRRLVFEGCTAVARCLNDIKDLF